MRLDRFPQKRRLLSGMNRKQKLSIVAIVLAVHLAAAAWWNLRAERRDLEIVEYVTYIDIAPIAEGAVPTEADAAALTEALTQPPAEAPKPAPAAAGQGATRR